MIPGRKPESVALPLPAPTTKAVTESGVDVTVYDSIFDPPLLAGSRNEISAEVLVTKLTEVTVGESGTDEGVTFTEAELALMPFRLLAWTETE